MATANRVRTTKVFRSKEARAFLRQREGLSRVANAMIRAARTEFGVRAALSLELYRDPEIADEYLTIYVRLPNYGEDVLERIRSVSEKFEKQLAEAATTILLTTDFRPKG